VIQTLDLARENTSLKEEVARLRRELAQLDEAIRTELPCSLGARGLDAAGAPYSESDDLLVVLDVVKRRCVSALQRPSASAQLVLVMPRYRASEYESFAGRFASVSDCEVIVDRRLAERRRARSGRLFGERRVIDRRTGRRERPAVLLLVH
jgi:hypothetical protein